MSDNQQPDWDQLIADAPWNGDEAELGPYSLRRDAVGFVEIIEWVDNREVHRATVKSPRDPETWPEAFQWRIENGTAWTTGWTEAEVKLP